MTRFVVCVAGALMVVGPGCSEEKECVPEPPASVRALYGVAPGAVTPFPSDIFTVEDGTTRTGRWIALPPEGTPAIEEGLSALMLPEKWVSLLNALDGFGVWAPILIPLSGEIDETTLPATPEDSTSSASSVFVVDVSPDSSTYAERVPVKVVFQSFDDGIQPERVLAIYPSKPFSPKTRYAVVVTREVLAADGSPLGPTADFSFASSRCPIPPDHPERSLLEAQRSDLEPLFDEPLSLKRNEVAVATVFTTQSIEDELSSMSEVIRSDVPAPQVDFDRDEDGLPDLYTPQDLPDAPDGAMKLGSVGLVARGVFLSPEFRNQEGDFQTGPDGKPEIISMAEIPFILALPADAGKQPYPVVILQHGHGGRKEYALYVAGYLAEEGVAVVAIDLVEHGERPDTGHSFMDVGNIPAIRANFEQSAADVMRLLQVIEASSAVDFVPGGTGDGTPDLDVNKVGMVGESAGAQVTAMAAYLESSLGAAVINVGGGGYASTLQHFFGEGVFSKRVILQLGVLVQMVFDRADPISYYRPYLPKEPGGPEIQVLIQEVIEDRAMANEATENLARVFECPLVRPYAREVEGLETVDSPAPRHGLFQFDPAEHGFLLADDDYPEASAAARRQVTSFMKGYFTDGTAVIEDPWR